MLASVSVQICAIINLGTKNLMWHRCKKNYKNIINCDFCNNLGIKNLKFSMVNHYQMQILAKNGLKKFKVLKCFTFKMTK